MESSFCSVRFLTEWNHCVSVIKNRYQNFTALVLKLLFFSLLFQPVSYGCSIKFEVSIFFFFYYKVKSILNFISYFYDGAVETLKSAYEKVEEF